MVARRGLAAACTLLMLAGLLSLASAAPAGAATRAVLYVANGRGNTVTVYDIGAATTVATIAVGTQPQGVTATPDGRTVYICNAVGGISVIDTATNTVTATIPDGSFPISMVLAPSGHTAYIANETGTVSVLDTSTNTITGTIAVGGEPLGLAITPDGSSLYVPDFIGNTLSVVSTATSTVTATMTGFSRPIGVSVTPDGSAAYVANATASNAVAIDTATNTVTATIPAGSLPHYFAITPDSATAYLTNTGSASVSVIDTATNTVTATIGVGFDPQGDAITPDGATVYVANDASDTVSAIDTATNTVTATIPVGSGPFALAVANVPVPVPAVTGISPTTGPLSGGTTVTITGSNFTGATGVSFGGIPAAGFTVNSDTSITAVSPAAASAGTVDVTVTTPNGTSAAGPADQFSYLYAFTGFLSPVSSPPALNEVHAGQAVPIQFSLGGDQGLNVIAAGFPTATQIDCSTGVPVNTGTLTDTAGGSGLQFDPSTNTYTYVWKTSKSWSGTCQQFDLRLNDGTDHTAGFQFQ
jgi:YVTN family beta-propeller protein